MARTRKRTAVIVGSAVLVIAALVVAMFAFGKPVTPQASSQAATPAGVAPAPAVGGAPDGGSDPLAVEIPGCVCHSDDPEIVAEHASYRMSQCFGCHQGGMPEMGQ